MDDIDEAQFNNMINAALAALAPEYKERLENVAFILEDEPTKEQRLKLNLRQDQTLFGLYEGTPLPRRGGALKILPDKITLFMKPLLAASADQAELAENIRHTIWHEVAHYFGLDHKRIHELDK